MKTIFFSRSFGIILWEMVTCTVPYNKIDPIAVMWGVAKGTLKLPIPPSIPEGFKLLMTMCWEQQPSNRPSFQQIIKHLDIKTPEIILFEQEQEYAELTHICSTEINENLSKLPTIDISSILQLTNDQLMEKRKEELQQITDIRRCYEIRTQQINTLYIELKSLMIQLEEREQKTLICYLASNNSTLLSSSTVTNKQDLGNTKNQSRRKKGPGHHRTNSKDNATLWTPPTISAIEDQEKRRASINETDKILTTDEKLNSSTKIISMTTINSPLPTISAIIDSKSNENNQELNRKNLKLDFDKPMNELIYRSNEQQSSTNLPILSSKLSNSSSEYRDETHYDTFPRQRRRRYININNNKTKCSSLISSPSTKFNPSNNQQSSQIDDHYRTDDLRKHPPCIKFHISSSIINDRSLQRKTIKHSSYTSSEEGEVEDIHNENYILDDEKYRAKHNHSFENCSSESEIYGKKTNHSTLKNDGMFSDEGGQISDDRPESRESTFNSEPEHE
ncbi:unnamed protein product [Rotaria sp. Silwood2]|nr:unnamed protein product [Rotaria sp. Silwood2]